MLDVSLLFFRLGLGSFMVFLHGLPKWTQHAANPDAFINVAGFSAELSFYMAVGAEGLCAVLVAIGVLSRLSALALVVAMLVAAFVVLADQPFAKKELALMFAMGFAFIAANGPGAYSLDRMLWKVRS